MKAIATLVVLGVLLSACGGAAPTPTVNVGPTQTRAAEITQVAAIQATASAPTATAVPTNTPIPPTATPIPPTATATQRPTPTLPPTATSIPRITPTPAAQKWHGVPIPPNAVLVQEVSATSVIYNVPENELTVAAFMKREWLAIGLVFVKTQVESETIYYIYSYPTKTTHLVAYGVTKRGENNSSLGLVEVE